MKSLLGAVITLWLLLAGAGVSATDQLPQAGLSLADIEVLSGALPGPVASDTSLTLELHSADVDGLRARLGAIARLDVISATAAALRVRVAPGAHFTQAPTEREHKASWVIDYDQPPVIALTNSWREERAEAPTGAVSATVPELQALTTFTATQITDPNYRNGMLIASQVARRREGDCTEYSVLQAALARSAGYASRLVFGLLMLARNDELFSYGHAWTEIHYDGVWHVADATQPALQSEVQGVWHVPIQLFENEGPGHTWELVDFANTRPNSVTYIGNSGEESKTNRFERNAD